MFIEATNYDVFQKKCINFCMRLFKLDLFTSRISCGQVNITFVKAV